MQKYMKYVYVLVSSVQDTYYEQFLLSVTSLRLKNPDAYITVLCDSKTKQNLQDKRNGYENIVSDIKIVPAPDNLSQKEVSRYIKTSMRRYVDGDFLFIDCDTIITDTISDIISVPMDIGAVLDKHRTIDFHSMGSYIIENDERLGFKSSTTNKHYNSGIIFCKDTAKAHSFFDTWHELWIHSNRKGITVDQPSFNEAIFRNRDIFIELNGIWNCQIAFNGIPYLSDAKVIHYYASSLITQIPPYSLASEDNLDFIKKTGTVSSAMLKQLQKPKGAFVADSRIIAGDAALDVVNSNFFAKLLWLRRKHPVIFEKLNKLILNIKNREHNKE
ncbi:hypothetical protein AGMMS49944_28420 [Spirochaetia bacterium]|nr:hypothetical protein AGMMS49944_28420 [Spirochaetia bacterium]